MSDCQCLPSLSSISTCRTPWCTPHQHEREVSHCHEVFHNHCVFFLLSNLHHVIGNVMYSIGFVRGHIFRKGCLDPQCLIIRKHHCVCRGFFVENQEHSIPVLHVHRSTQLLCIPDITISTYLLNQKYSCTSLTSPFLCIYLTIIFLHISITTYLLNQNILAHL